jgi:hypothetical protein
VGVSWEKKANYQTFSTFMKTPLLIAALLFSTGAWAHAQTAVSPPEPRGAADRAAKRNPDERGPHTRAWFADDSATVNLPGVGGKDRIGGGQRPSNAQPLVEMASGLNYWNGHEWIPSNPTFKLTEDAFIADEVQHKVQLGANLNSIGAVKLRTPKGHTLESTPLGIRLYDAASGRSLVIAAITNCVGTLVESNVVVYRNAFEGVDADIFYTLDRGSFEQDVVIAERLNPADYNFPTNTTRIQILTEFYDGQEPDVIRQPLRVEKDKNRRARMVEPDLMDEVLDFGDLVFDAGTAFSQNSHRTEGRSLGTVAKEFKKIGGRSFLIESIEYGSIRPRLASLPRHKGALLAKARTTNLKTRDARAEQFPQAISNGKAASPRLAKAGVPKREGVVIDYLANIGPGFSTPTVFRGDSTYFVTGPVYCYGTTTIEGGTVFKYPIINGSGIQPYVSIGGALVCKTASYRPAVFTAADDDSVGQSLSGSGGWAGYTGNPAGKYYANPALKFSYSHNVSLSNVRFHYAQQAVQFVERENDGGSLGTVSHAQFLNCIQGVVLSADYGGCGCGSGSGSSSGGCGAQLSLENCLMSDVRYPFTTYGLPGLYSWTFNLRNCTIDQAVVLATSSGSVYYIASTINAVNSVFANIPTLASGTVYWMGNYNGFYQTPQFGGANRYTPSDGYSPFQPVNHYLTDSSGFRDRGTAAIPAALLADLRKRTTSPPLVYSTIPSDFTLGPTVQRDTDNYVDLGYHYDPIDYALGGVVLNNATVTVNPGTVIATFGTATGNYGLSVGSGGQFVCEGTPANLNRIVGYNTVQEGNGAGWRNPAYGSLTDAQGGSGGTFKFRCTDWSLIGPNNVPHLSIYYGAIIALRDCQFHGGGLLTYSGQTINLTNCLLDSVYTALYPGDANVGVICNNTFYGGIFDLLPSGTPSAVVKDNLFDRTAIYDNSSAYTYSGGYNAYLTNSSRLQPPAPGDLIMSASPVYASGTLGNFYLPSNSQLIDHGSRTAAAAGLFHYTVKISKLKEGNDNNPPGTVDIGYHYVAVDGSNVPVDSNGDGIPDYLEDPNGNGINDPGETPWNIAIQTDPPDHVAFARGSASFTAVVGGGFVPATFQWQFNAANISAATAATLTLNNLQLNQAGTYTVMVRDSANALLTCNSVLSVIDCASTASGRVGWWQGEGNAREVTGLNPGVLEGNVTFGTGKVGQAFSFDGGSDLRVPASASLNVGASSAGFTVECWIKPADLAGNQALVEWNNGPAGVHFWISQPTAFFGGGPGCLYANLVDTGGGFHLLTSAGNTLNTLGFQHVALTYDKTSGMAKLYYNGSVVASQNLGSFTPQTTYDLFFGHRPSNDPPGFFKGLLDEVGLYNRALSGSEIASLYNASKAGKCGIAPSLLSQPASRIVTQGNDTVFRVVAAGTSLSYQWYLNGTAIANATDSVLQLASVQLNQAGNYYVSVINSMGSATSATAALTVNPPVCVAAPSGLVSWWQAENNAYDVYGLNPGSLQGNVTFAAGKVGQSFNLNGTDQYVELPNSSSLNPPGSFTVDAWIFPTQGGRDQTIVGKWGDSDDYAENRSYVLALTPGNGLRFAISDADHQWDGSFHLFDTSNDAIAPNKWTHVAGVYDQNTGTRRMYINGLEAAARTDPPITVWNGIAKAAIGAQLSSSTLKAVYFAGKIDEVALYGRALSGSEVAAIYNAGSAGKCGIAPSIITQPASRTVTQGNDTVFQVVAAGTSLSCQWYLNGAPITGGTGTALTLANVQPAQQGAYSVTVANTLGSVSSTPAQLTVNPAQCVAAPSGLVSWWPANNNANDIIGGNHGTLTGGATFTTGKVGTAFNFDGVNDTVIVPDASSLRLTSQLTIEAWIKPRSIGGDQSIVAKVGGVGGNNGYQLAISGSSLIGQFNSPGEDWPSQWITFDGPIAPNVWTHVAWTYDQSAMKLYVNGQLVATEVIGAHAINTSSSPLRISGDDNNHVYFNGQIDEPAIYNRALLDTEIAAQYNASIAGKCNDSDGNGLQDAWEIRYFGSIGQNPSADPDADGLSNLQEFQQGTNPTKADTDGDGLTDGEEIRLGLSPFLRDTGNTGIQDGDKDTDHDGRSNYQELFIDGTDPLVFTPTSLAHWYFDDTNTWVGAQGQLPLTINNIFGQSGWSSNALTVDSLNSASIRYRVVETNHNANILCTQGTVRFWFKPDWGTSNSVPPAWQNSFVTNSGPQTSATLFCIGTNGAAAGNGYWGLATTPDGGQIQFMTGGDGVITTNLQSSILWNDRFAWHQIALTYSSTNSLLYIDNQLVATGLGVAHFPQDTNNSQGFAIGSDLLGSASSQARGAFDELEIFNYPLSATAIATNYHTSITLDSDEDGLPNLVEVRTPVDINNLSLGMLDPYNAYTGNSTIQDGQIDSDHDGLSNYQEANKYHTDPANPNTITSLVQDAAFFKMGGAFTPSGLGLGLTTVGGTAVITLLGQVTESAYDIYYLPNLNPTTRWRRYYSGSPDQHIFTMMTPSSGQGYFIALSAEDSDGDGLSDGFEARITQDPNPSNWRTHHADLTKVDTDGDQMPDGWEVEWGLDPDNSTGNNGGSAVLAGDGINNLAKFTSHYPNINAGDQNYDPFNPAATARPEMNITVNNPTAHIGTPAIFTINRVGRSGSAIDVKYTLGGTAIYGVDYTISPAPAGGYPDGFSVHFPASATSETITVTPIAVSGSPTTKKVVLALAPYTLEVSPNQWPYVVNPKKDKATASIVQSYSYTFDVNADFDQGLLMGVNHAVINNQLQLNDNLTVTSPIDAHKINPGSRAQFPYIAVACGSFFGGIPSRETLVRINTSTGKIVGEYLTRPDGHQANPSRTTVDQFGNVWVANRAEDGLVNGVAKGSITRIALIIGGTRGTKNPVTGAFTPDPSPLPAGQNPGEYLKGPFDYCTAIDRDGDGLIHTSSGLNDILQWSNSDPGAHGVSEAQDEAITEYVRVGAIVTRAIAVDKFNDIWAGSFDQSGNSGEHDKVNGLTAEMIPSATFNEQVGGYGAVIDQQGVLWSADRNSRLMRFDTTQAVTPGANPIDVMEAISWPANLKDGYGVGVDPNPAVINGITMPSGFIYNVNFGNGKLMKINPDGTFASAVESTCLACQSRDVGAQGLVVDQNGHVWVAHSSNGRSVGHVDKNGNFLGDVPVGRLDVGGNIIGSPFSGPTGVAVDDNDKIWATCFNHGVAARIDPTVSQTDTQGNSIQGKQDLVVDLNTFDASGNLLVVDAQPYNYSDMTGFAVHIVNPDLKPYKGYWIVTKDSGVTGLELQSVSWNPVTQTGGGRVEVEVRAADNRTDLYSQPFALAGNGSLLTGVKGRYIEVRTALIRDSLSDNPILTDLTLNGTTPTLVITSPLVTQYIPEQQSGQFSIAASGTDPLSYQWSFKDSGGNNHILNNAGASLGIAWADCLNQGVYTVQVTDASGSSLASSAALNVVPTIQIPMGKGSELAGFYPALLDVTGQPAIIDKITVSINGFEHNTPQNVNILLVSPAGTTVVLMNRICASGQCNQVIPSPTTRDLIFKDDGQAFLTLANFSSGNNNNATFRPTVNLPFVTWPAPAPQTTSTYQTTLASLQGQNPNGKWKLFVYDTSPTFTTTGKITASWCLTIEAHNP